MYAKVWNYLRGSVLLQCESPAPERVLNLCGVYDIPFWDVTWQTAERFTLYTTRQGAAALEQAAAECGAVLTRRKEQGAAVTAGRLRRRYVLWGAAALMAALFWYGSTFIWDFQVTGNETVPRDKILRAMEQCGVTIGTRSLSFSQEELRNHVLLELPDISWLSVNIKGCTAHVQVAERKRPPEIVNRGVRANIVAARDGLVTKVEALDGKALVMAGSTVTKGQLLISGVSDSRFGGVRFMQGRGHIYARTWYELSVPVPLQAEEKTDTKKSVQRIAVDIGKRRINLYGKGSILEAGCDKIVTYRPLRLPFGLRLPLTLSVERTTRRCTRTVERTTAQAKAEGERCLLAQLDNMLTQGGMVTSTHFSTVRQGETLLVTLRAECAEQIGVSVAVETE